MDNQAKYLKVEKDGVRLSQTMKEKNAKIKLENKKKESKLWKKTGSKDCMWNFICLSFFNLKVDIIFVTLYKLNILL